MMLIDTPKIGTTVKVIWIYDKKFDEGFIIMASSIPGKLPILRPLDYNPSVSSQPAVTRLQTWLI